MQLRCGYAGHDIHENLSETASFEINVESDADRVISEYLVCLTLIFLIMKIISISAAHLLISFLVYNLQLTFKDINGLVEQNVQLRSLVRKLSVQLQDTELDFKVCDQFFPPNCSVAVSCYHGILNIMET